MLGQDHAAPPESGKLAEKTGTRDIRRRTLSVLLTIFGVVAIAITVTILLLPPLLSPPPEPGPIYDLFDYGELSASLDPGIDRLLETHDGQVALYVPVGAYAGAGTMVIQPRDSQFVPLSAEGPVERIRAVDLLILDLDGNLVEAPHFEVELLLCFRLSIELQTMRQADGGSLGVQRFDEGQLNWLDLSTGPGWDHDQICATIDHLSIFALRITHPEAEATATVGPKVGATSTPFPLEIYTFPEGDS